MHFTFVTLIIFFTVRQWFSFNFLNVLITVSLFSSRQKWGTEFTAIVAFYSYYNLTVEAAVGSTLTGTEDNARDIIYAETDDADVAIL